MEEDEEFFRSNGGQVLAEVKKERDFNLGLIYF